MSDPTANDNTGAPAPSTEPATQPHGLSYLEEEVVEAWHSLVTGGEGDAERVLAYIAGLIAKAQAKLETTTGGTTQG